jgi:hypothetical protein
MDLALAAVVEIVDDFKREALGRYVRLSRVL